MPVDELDDTDDLQELSDVPDLDDSLDAPAEEESSLEVEEIDQPLLSDEPELALDTEPVESPLEDALLENVPVDDAEDDTLDLSDSDSFETSPVDEAPEISVDEPLSLEDDHNEPFASETPTLDLDEPILDEVETDADDSVLDLDASDNDEPLAEALETPEPVTATPESQAAPATSGPVGLDDAQLDQLAEKVAARIMEQLGTDAIRDVVWEVVPELAEAMIKKRIYQLEQSSDED